MANHFSALKRARQTITRTAVNRASKSKAIHKGAIHKNTAGRYKSRLSVRVKALDGK